MPVHELEHSVAAALQRYVEMRHERAALGAIVYQFVGEKVGLDAAYAVAVYSLYPIEGLDQSEKCLAGGLAKIAYVHSR